MSDELFLTRDELEQLGIALDELSGSLLELEMAVALTGGARHSIGGIAGAPGSRPPYSIELEQHVANLTNELSTTIRHIEEHRPGLVFAGSRTITGMAKWLHQKRVALAMLEDAGECYDALMRKIACCTRVMNVGEREYVISQARVDEANRQSLTAGQVEKLAHKLGNQGRGLSKRRVETLAARHGLKGWKDPDTGVSFYRLGDVLAAHASTRTKVTRREPA